MKNKVSSVFFLCFPHRILIFYSRLISFLWRIGKGSHAPQILGTCTLEILPRIPAEIYAKIYSEIPKDIALCTSQEFIHDFCQGYFQDIRIVSEMHSEISPEIIGEISIKGFPKKFLQVFLHVLLQEIQL